MQGLRRERGQGDEDAGSMGQAATATPSTLYHEGIYVAWMDRTSWEDRKFVSVRDAVDSDVKEIRHLEELLAHCRHSVNVSYCCLPMEMPFLLTTRSTASQVHSELLQGTVGCTG